MYGSSLSGKDEQDPFEEWPELRNRALVFTGKMARAGNPPTMEEIMEKQEQMREAKAEQESGKSFQEMFDEYAGRNTETVYVVVDDGEIAVMTEHHSVVKNVVADSLVEGEGATIDVQTFEVDL